MVLIYIVLFTSLCLAQEMQIKYTTVFSIDAKIIGPIETTFDRIVAPGYAKVIMKIDAKKWLPSTFIDREEGTIMMTSVDKILKYDVEEEEYWLVNRESYFREMDGRTKTESSSNKDVDRKNSGDNRPSFISNSFFDIDDSFDEDDKPIQRKIDRTSSDLIENVNGFNAKKWTTSIEFISSTRSKNIGFIFEEWIVDELPLKDNFHSLLHDVKAELNPLEYQKDEFKFNFSSDDFVKSADSTSTLEPLEGYIVKAKAVLEDHFFNSMTFKITELYTVPFKASSFTIPEEYERIQKEGKK